MATTRAVLLSSVITACAALVSPDCHTNVPAALVVAAGNADTQAPNAILEEVITVPVPALLSIDGWGLGVADFPTKSFAGRGRLQRVGGKRLSV